MDKISPPSFQVLEEDATLFLSFSQHFARAHIRLPGRHRASFAATYTPFRSIFAADGARSFPASHTHDTKFSRREDAEAALD